LINVTVLKNKQFIVQFVCNPLENSWEKNLCFQWTAGVWFWYQSGAFDCQEAFSI